MRAAIDREIAALRQQVVKLENEQRVSKALSTKEGDIESIKAEAEKEITTLREQIGFLKQAGADQEILALRGQLAALRRQETMTKEASSATAALAEAEQEIRRLRAQVAALAKSDSTEAAPARPDFSDLSDQVDVSQSPAVAATAASNVKVEGDSIRAGANQQITAMREQMEAMRAEMGQLLAAQKLRDAQNTELEKRIALLAGMLEGRVESSTLASLTASGDARGVSPETGDGSSSAQTKSRVAAGSDSDGKSVWQKWFDKLPEDDESRIAIAAGILLILLLLWLLIRRHRALMRMEQSILMASGNMDEAASQLSEFKSKKPRYLSDLSIAGMGRMEAAEVDPLAEAEVYLAYGRARQALQVLKEASSRNPDRKELKLKLLEVYQQEDDVNSFDDLVAEMDLSEEDMDQAAWSKVVELKLKMQEKSPLQTPELDDQNDSQESESSPSGSADGELPLDESIEKQNSREKIPASELPRDVLAKASVPVDPALRPFPEPDENARVGEEVLGTLGRADESGSGSRSETIPPGASSDDSDMMNFATSKSSELDFDLEADLEKQLDPESDSTAPAAADESQQTSARDRARAHRRVSRLRHQNSHHRTANSVHPLPGNGDFP